MGDDLWTVQSQHKDGKRSLNFCNELLRLKFTEMRASLLRGELTYSDEAKGRVREVRQGDSWLVEVGGLVGKGYRIVRIGSVARNITSK